MNAVKAWMATNQLGRRNLSDYVKGELLSYVRNLLRDVGKEKLIEIGKTYGEGHKKEEGLPIIGKGSHDSRNIIADKLGWSHSKEEGLSIIDKGSHDTRKIFADKLGWITGKTEPIGSLCKSKSY